MGRGEARVAIVGRPNVGKSTLFNRLVGRRTALVHDTPGVTRDRKEAQARLHGLAFSVVDTAGLEEAAAGAIENRMAAQALRALEGAAVALFLIDARAGVTPDDRHFANLLRRAGTPVLLLANKCEGRDAEPGRLDAFGLGLGEPLAISAEHGLGMGDLRLALGPYLEGPAETGKDAAAEMADRPMSLAIVGRPNAGKSTLFNRLIGEERVLTGPEPGITRDAISFDWRWPDTADGRPIRLIDTAGVRRRAKVDGSLEKLSVMDTWRAIRFADIVVLMIDAQTVQAYGYGLEKQDLTIARQVEEEGRGLAIAANKWDLVSDPQKVRRQIGESLGKSLSQLRGVPLACISALDGQGIDRLMGAVLKIDAAWNSRVGTGALNRWIETMQEAHQPPLVNGRRIRIRYATQVKARPPTFALFANKPADLPDSYLRYLANGLRDSFGLDGVPLRLYLRKGKNPYAETA
ncbi:MAG: ribosome biogenesis GTPase Der [Rhodospirillaceae bacterium]|nr:ribosome biogenesis GTPase Der [Rhodospirillaceae bacterium]MYH36147.1 ribosome biogenesis GTPase Der [Rhodospirillaceae bacterium]MYK15006.1 ribosome biogenesis GTPase Der [Rhodospirillaceae bacterium]MYK57356.1 ribosome biogenesis GTPase Der [Rhodospirillaceae bacterium]